MRKAFLCCDVIKLTHVDLWEEVGQFVVNHFVSELQTLHIKYAFDLQHL